MSSLSGGTFAPQAAWRQIRCPQAEWPAASRAWIAPQQRSQYLIVIATGRFALRLTLRLVILNALERTAVWGSFAAGLTVAGLGYVAYQAGAGEFGVFLYLCAAGLFLLSLIVFVAAVMKGPEATKHEVTVTVRFETVERSTQVANGPDDQRPNIHIESHNQSGGIIAHTVNVQGPLPVQARISPLEHEATSDGHKYRGVVTLDTQFVVPALVIAAKGRTVTSVHAAPMTGGAMFNVAEGYFNDGSGHFTQFDNASGAYQVEVTTREPEVPTILVSQTKVA